MFKVRAGNEMDAYGLGLLVQESILNAPSSQWEWDELPQDPSRIGRRLLGEGGDVLLCHVVDVGGFIVGVAQAVKGEFLRCQHASTGVVLVRPSARHHGVGRALVRSMVATCSALASPEGGKLSVRVSAQDHVLVALLASEGWRVEQEVKAGLCVDGVSVVVRVYATDV